MKTTFALVASFLLPLFATAASLSDGQANFRCEGEKGGYAFELPYNENATRVWLTNGPADKVGEELEVTETLVARCPNCFNIKARVEVLGQASEFGFNLHGEGPGFIPVLTVTIADRPLSTLSCVRAN